MAQLLGDRADLGSAPRLGQYDGPLFGGLPTENWRTGKLYRDTITFRTTADSALGAYLVLLGLTDNATGQRLALEVQSAPEGVTAFAGDSVLIRGLTIWKP